MAIGEICSRDVVLTRRDTSVREAARLMREHHVGALVVVEETGEGRRPVGVLTDRDIVVGIVAKGLDADGLRVDEVMAPQVITASERAGVAEAMELMRAKGVRRVPVVDARGMLVGIVTADDFVDLLAEEMSALARMIVQEQHHESAGRKV